MLFPMTLLIYWTDSSNCLESQSDDAQQKWDKTKLTNLDQEVHVISPPRDPESGQERSEREQARFTFV
jgi:hypothetical protein